MQRIRQDTRGVSFVIVVALGLIIVVTIVVNIFLWKYEMNQLDWEKMKEEITITDVARVANSSWFVVQSEYAVNIGSRINGTYTDTQVVDSSYERFSEATGDVSNTTLIDAESFEGGWPPTGWNETGNWARESNYAYDGTYSADFDGSSGGQSGYLTSPSMDCSGASAIYVDFWWYDRGLDDDDFELEYYDGSVWDNYQDLNQLESGNGWHHYTETLTDNQYFVSNFQIRWWAKDMWSGETSCVDLVTVKKEARALQLDLNGTFTIDLSAYPVGYIQTVEIQLRCMANDTGEKWYLKAYNWSSSTYSDSGFNSTAGYTPTTGWDYYAVNLTDGWRSYVHDNGTMYVKFVDESADSNQTTIDIDFLGVRAKIDGTCFTFKNEGALTSHLISLWIINSTNHQRYDINVFINSAETTTYVRTDIALPESQYTVKVVTERGNTAVYSGS